MPNPTDKIQPAGWLIQNDQGLSMRTVYSLRSIRARCKEQTGFNGPSSLMIVVRPGEHVRLDVREAETDLLFSTKSSASSGSWTNRRRGFPSGRLDRCNPRKDMFRKNVYTGRTMAVRLDTEDGK
jgi:hypothetical protein